jgi:hypothetical protein
MKLILSLPSHGHESESEVRVTGTVGTPSLTRKRVPLQRSSLSVQTTSLRAAFSASHGESISNASGHGEHFIAKLCTSS